MAAHERGRKEEESSVCCHAEAQLKYSTLLPHVFNVRTAANISEIEDHHNIKTLKKRKKKKTWEFAVEGQTDCVDQTQQ